MIDLRCYVMIDLLWLCLFPCHKYLIIIFIYNHYHQFHHRHPHHRYYHHHHDRHDVNRHLERM